MNPSRNFCLAIASSILLFVFGCQTMRSEATVNVPVTENLQDEALSQAVRERLVNNSKVNLGAVNVVSSNRTVYLTGTVRSLDARQQAAKIAWSSPGVETVINTLQVKE